MNRPPVLWTLALVAATAGCSVVRVASDEPGADMSFVASGAPRALLEDRLGAAVREWRNASGTEFRTYQYDAGRRGSSGDAWALAVVDVCSLCLWELWFAFQAEPFLRWNRLTGRVVVAYDADGIAVGVFEEFVVLPADGRAPPGSAPWTPIPLGEP